MAKSKRNRNLITGILVCVTAIFAVTYYLEVPGSDITGFLLATLMFFGGILLLAIVAVFILKSLGRLLKRNNQEEDKSSE